MNDPLFSVSDQVVIVSGGTRGIGCAIARGFAERGAKVVVTGTEPSSTEQAAQVIGGDGMTVVPITCDVLDNNQIERLVQETSQRFGRIDTLVNVAGVNRRIPALEFSEENYDLVVNTNLKGAFFLSQAVGKVMKEQGQGNQINIASLTTDRPLKHVAPYAMSKAAIGHMTRALALEWGPYGIRVNAVAPGFVLTDLTKKLWSDKTMQEWGLANTPLRRLGQPEDMIGASIFLASKASEFMTGQVIYVDGGFNAGWAWPIPEGGGQ